MAEKIMLTRKSDGAQVDVNQLYLESQRAFFKGVLIHPQVTDGGEIIFYIRQTKDTQCTRCGAYPFDGYGEIGRVRLVALDEAIEVMGARYTTAYRGWRFGGAVYDNHIAEGIDMYEVVCDVIRHYREEKEGR